MLDNNAEKRDPMVAYEDAKRFWEDWVSDPDADMKFGESNGFDVVVPGLIERYQQHPIQARHTARAALDSVLDWQDTRES